MPMKKTHALLLITLLLAGTLTADVRGKLECFVVDMEKNPIEGVDVSIISIKMSTKQFIVKTNDKGKFTQIGVWPGYYQINLKKEGFQPLTTEVKVEIAESSQFQFTLKKVDEAIQEALSDADKNFVKGNRLFEAQKYEEAADAFTEAIQFNSDNWGYYFNLGLSYKKLNSREKSLDAFKKAHELNPESFGANMETGEALAKLEQFAEAKPFYQKAVEKNTDDPDLFYNYGVVLINLGESQDALAAFEKAVYIQDDYTDAYYQLGTLYIGQNKVEDAVKNLEKFLSLAPDHAQAPIARQLLEYLKK